MKARKDLKSYLLESTSNFYSILLVSSRLFVLPSIIIAPTNRCNQKCSFCIAEPIRRLAAKKEVMDFSVMEKILNDCSELLVKPIVHIMGHGETLLYPHIKETMQLCAKKKLKWSLGTNGLLLADYAEYMVENKCFAVNLSLHGNASEHNAIANSNSSYKKIVEGINQVVKVKKKLNKTRPSISINCVINNYNIANLREIHSELMKLPVESITFQHLLYFKDDFKKKKDFLITDRKKLNKLIDFVDYIKKFDFNIRTNVFPNVKSGDIIGYYTKENYKFSKSCIFPWISVMVDPDGTVRSLEESLGDIKEEPLMEILNSKKSRSFRNDVKKGKYNSTYCFRCCFRKY